MNCQATLSLDQLPADIPVFPLSRVILLPDVQVPLNIFEPRYLAMTNAAMAGNRLIGIVQPQDDAAVPALYKTGGAGRIVSFSETDDGRYLITLKGVCRFNISQELAVDAGGFRRVAPDWAPYAADLQGGQKTNVCRDPIMNALRHYFDKMNMFCDKWETMQEIPCEKLISTLSVICPFDIHEKQALLEAMTLADRARILQAIIESAIIKQDSEPCCH